MWIPFSWTETSTRTYLGGADADVTVQQIMPHLYFFNIVLEQALESKDSKTL